MSLIQNEIIEEMLYENGFCTECMQKLEEKYISCEMDGVDTSFYETVGHESDCSLR